MTNYALYSNSMGSGKTHYSKVWEKNGFTPISLATPLKEQVHEYLDKEGIKYNPNKKETKIVDDKSLRDLYISFAKQNKAKLGDDIFIKQLLEQVNNNPDKQFICDDVRTPEEYQALKDNGFVFIFVDRLLDTPNNEMEGLLFSDVANHLYTTNGFVIPNYYMGSPNYDQFIFSHVVEGKEIKFGVLTKILVKGLQLIQNNYDPSSPYKLTVAFKNTKKIDRAVYILCSKEGDTLQIERSMPLHSLKDVCNACWFVKSFISICSETQIYVDKNLDSVVELIQMDNEEEE